MRKFRITENRLHGIIRETVKRVLMESEEPSFEEMINIGRRELPKYIEDAREDALAEYYAAPEEYFNDNPNMAQCWKEQLENEFNDSIEGIIWWWVARRFYGDAACNVYYSEHRPINYTLACKKLCDYFA